MKPLNSLTVGAHVFHPSHGVALVDALEERDVGGQQQSFYVLALTRRARLLLPKANIERHGMRALITKAEARKLVSSLTTEPSPSESSPRERVTSYETALRTGDAREYTDTLRQLLWRSRRHRLTPSEQSALKTARSYFVSEMGAVLNRTSQQLGAMLSSVTDSATATPKARS
jgi:CarD family transcriptional regulator